MHKQKMKNASGKLKSKMSPLSIIMLIVLVLYSLTIIGCIGWAFLNSLKDYVDFRTNKFGLPVGHVWDWKWENYYIVYRVFKVKISSGAGFRVVGIPEMVFNTLVLSLGINIVGILCNATTAYLSCKFKFRMSKILYAIVIFMMTFPTVGTTPAKLKLVKDIGLYNSLWGQIVLTIGIGGGIHWLVYYSCYETIPNAYAEAAKIDGANNYQIYFKIIFPMTMGINGIFFLTGVIAFWHEYQNAILFYPSYPTITLGMYYFSNFTYNSLSSVPMKLTGCMILAIPVIVLFVIFRKKLIGTVSMGGLK